MEIINPGTIKTSINEINIFKQDPTILTENSLFNLSKYQRNNLNLISSFINQNLSKIDKENLDKKFKFFLDDANPKLENSFAFSPPMSRNNFPMIDPIMIRTNFYNKKIQSIKNIKKEFNQKSYICYWRGALTGIVSEKLNLINDKNEYFNKILDPDIFIRIKLCFMGSQELDKCDFKLTRAGQWKWTKSILEKFKENNIYSEEEPFENNLDYKYLIDIDGNSNSWPGLFMKLASGSCILKVESKYKFYQWFYQFMKPWEHFVPINSDLSDLNEKLIYLRNNEEIGEKIAKNSTEFFGSKNPEKWKTLYFKDLNVNLAKYKIIN